MFALYLFSLTLPISLSSDILIQGEVCKGVVYHNQVERILFDGNEISFLVQGDSTIFFLGTSYHTKPGTHLIQIFFPKGVLIDTTIFLKKRQFPHQFIRFPPSKRELLASKKIKEEKKELLKILRSRSVYHPFELSPYFPPVRGEITSEYGVERREEGGRVLWHHSGMDIKVPENTPIIAPSSGLVVLSEKFTLQGEFIVLDHGAGVKSVYYHLSRRLKNEGEFVTKGDTIGLSGGTGLSTGPHLHFGIYVNGVCVDPIFWYAMTSKW